MQKSLLTLLITLTSLWVWAQQDSLTLVEAPWVCDTLDGMILKSVQFTSKEYFNSNQYIAVLEIPADGRHRLRFAHEPRRTRTSTMAKKHDALAAVNGSFFDMVRHFPICYLRIDGEEKGINTPGKDTVNRKYYQYGTLVLPEEGSWLATILQTDSNRFWERYLPNKNIMTGGPLLIFNGQDLPMRNDLAFVRDRHNRTAVGTRPDGTLLLLVVDGRTKQSEGMSLDELTATLRWLGCDNALNMDGGGSTTLYIQGKGESGVLNHPSDNGQFDTAGERPVSNAILVLPAKRAD